MSERSDSPTFTAGELRDRFRIPLAAGGRESIYLCGHALGPQPVAAADAVAVELDRWARLGMAGYFDEPLAWASYHEWLTEPLAELAGAYGDEVVASGSQTANLHQMLVSFFRPNGRRRRIVVEKGAIPADRHAAASQLTLHGLSAVDDLVELAPRRDALRHEDDLEDYLERYGDSVALVLWPGVHHVSGQVFDLARIARAAHRAGARVGFNLAQAIGNVELDLHQTGPDFAVWCSYRHLNGGPGAIAGIFVHRRHARFEGPRLAGWWGQEAATRFHLAPDYRPMRGAPGWQLSTPPILSAAPLRGALELFSDAGGMGPLRRASLDLTGHLARRVGERLDDRIDIVTPLEPQRRGSQLSLRVLAGRKATHELLERLEGHGVICDWCQPDIVRASPAPLYNTEEDVERFVDLLDRLTPAP